MAPPRRLSNGRSPLVNQQSQITKFFNKTTSPPSNPPPTLSKRRNPKLTVNQGRSPSPTTPSPHQPTIKTGTTKTVSYGEEVVNKGIRVYWPLDQSWYQGRVREFDELSGKHKVQYEDGEEEELYLCKERIAWVEDKAKSSKRLRKGVGVKVGKDLGDDENKDRSSGDESSDEARGKEVSADKLDDMVSDDEDDAEFQNKTPDTGSKKRKVGVKEMCGSSKKSKSVGEAAKENAIPSSDDSGNLAEQMNKCESE